MNSRKIYVAVGCILLLLPLTFYLAKGASHPLKPDQPPAKQIHWVQGKEKDFEDSVRKLKRPAFLYIYISSWEDVAKFNQNVLADTNIINYVDSNYMAYKIDMETDWQDAMHYMIDGVPAVILLNRNGGELARQQGYCDAKAFRKFLKQGVK